jgi:integrase
VARKRGNGEGSITRRKDGLYMARYTVQTATGTKRKTLYGKTRREVDEKLTKAKADRYDGLVFDADNLKLGEYLGRWLADSVRDTVRPTSFERYEQMVRLHIHPVLGNVKLKNLTSAHVRGLYREKLDAGLSPRSVQYVHVTLHKALKQAIADGLIPRNATEAVRPPQVQREEMRPLIAEQVRILFDAVKGDRLEALYILAVTTGLRQGELLGLKWDDIDLEVGTLQVRRTLTTAKGGPVLSAPKTKGSRRTVKLSQTALEALRSHLERQLVEIDRGPAVCGVRTASYSRRKRVSRWTAATLPRTASSPCSSGPGCRRYASTTYGTRAPRSCSPRTLTPRSSRRCSGTPP